MKNSKKAPPPEPTATLAPLKIPKALHEAARAKTLRTGVPMSFVLRRALEKWVEGKLELDGAEK